MIVAQNDLHGLSAVAASGLIFTDPKLNAMREAAVAGDWAKLFRIQPRGCTRAMDKGLTRADGSYGHCAEPQAYGGIDRADHPQGRRDYLWWLQNNPLRKQLTINDLRFTKDANGRIVKVPYTRAELQRYYNNHQISKRQWYCGAGQIKRYVDTAYSGSHPVYPIAQCAQTSSSRRRKIIKKIAIIAAGATGAVIFGPALIAKAGSLLSGAGAGAGAAATGAAASGAAGAAGAAATTGWVGSVGALAAKAVPMAAKVISGVSTVRALKDGKMPPPPISLGDGTFTGYASLVGTKLVERELGKHASEAEQQLLAQYVELERRRLAAVETPHLPVVNSGLHPTLTAAQKTRADAAVSDSNLLKMAAVGIPATLLLARVI